MRYSIAAVALAAGASANYGAYNVTSEAPVYTTEVLTAYTTYCPYATQVSHNGVTYTVTEATTLTITNCPCTVTKPVYTSAVTSASAVPVISTSAVPVVYTTAKASASSAVYVVSSSKSEVVSTSTPVATYALESVSSTAVVPSATPIVPGSPSSPVYHNGTVPATVVAPSGTAPAGTGSATATKPASFTGAANKMAASGAGLAGLLGLAAFIL